MRHVDEILVDTKTKADAFTTKQNEELELATQFLNKWADDELQQREFGMNEIAKEDLMDDCFAELSNIVNLTDALQGVGCLDDAEIFYGLNKGFTLYIDERAKCGLYMRDQVAKEISSFTKITDLIRAAFISKQAVHKIRGYYEGLKIDLEKLIKERDFLEHKEAIEKYGDRTKRDYSKEPLN